MTHAAGTQRCRDSKMVVTAVVGTLAHSWDSIKVCIHAASGGRSCLALACDTATSDHSLTTTRGRATAHAIGALGYAAEAHEVRRSRQDSPQSRTASGPQPVAHALGNSRTSRRQQSRAPSPALERAAAGSRSRRL
jgi:hypothetical protein